MPVFILANHYTDFNGIEHGDNWILEERLGNTLPLQQSFRRVEPRAQASTNVHFF